MTGQTGYEAKEPLKRECVILSCAPAVKLI